MEVIIIAAIALLVLVILSMLVIQRGKNLSTECTNLGGTCGSKGSCSEGFFESPSTGGCPSGENVVCCMKLGGSQS